MEGYSWEKKNKCGSFFKYEKQQEMSISYRPKLYFVKVDIQACFDTIEQTKLLWKSYLRWAEQMIKTAEYWWKAGSIHNEKVWSNTNPGRTNREKICQKNNQGRYVTTISEQAKTIMILDHQRNFHFSLNMPQS